MAKGPPRAGRAWSTYLELAIIWQLKERSRITPAMLDVAWTSFFNWYKAYPKKDSLLDDFTAGAEHYKGSGWHLPSWNGMFTTRSGQPIMNVLRHAQQVVADEGGRLLD